jgi:hypothetical protein
MQVRDDGFAAHRFAGVGTNNLSLIDQSLTNLQVGEGVELTPHLIVGNLGTIRTQVNFIYNAGR